MSAIRSLGRTFGRSTRAALIATVAMPAVALAASSGFAFAQDQVAQTADPSAANPTTAPSLAEQRAISAEVRATLSQFGSFVVHQKYGEVWLPTSLPQGWHPYPACNWKNDAKLGWFYDDQTAWGRIVHHYGRWAHDAQAGWIWVPGSEFSPGWVSWRTSPEWVGWAPLPPDEDIRTAATGDFDKADLWTFIEAKKFAEGCTTTAVAGPAEIVPILQQTTFVRSFGVVDGIIVAHLPTYVFGPIVHIHFGFKPWAPWFFTQTLFNWNWFWNNVSIKFNVLNLPCPPLHKPGKDPDDKAPPPPKHASHPIDKAPPPNGGPKPPPGVGFLPPLPPVVHLPPPVKPDDGIRDVRQPGPALCPPGLMARGNFCLPGDQAKRPRPLDKEPQGQPPTDRTPPKGVAERPPVDRLPPGGKLNLINGADLATCNLTRCNPSRPPRPGLGLQARPQVVPPVVPQVTVRPRPLPNAQMQPRPIRPVAIVQPVRPSVRLVQPSVRPVQPVVLRQSGPARQVTTAAKVRQPGRAPVIR